MHFSCRAWGPRSPRAVEGIEKNSCKDRQLNLLKVESCVQRIFFLFLGLFKLLMVDSVGVTTTDSHIQTLLQNFTIPAANFRPVL